MMDLVSTRPTTDPQTARCARLLAAVIAEHVRDAAQLPDREERLTGRIPYAARAAVEWIFDADTTFDLYATLIGVSPDGIRQNLLRADIEGASTAPGVALNQQQRHALRARVHALDLAPASTCAA